MKRVLLTLLFSFFILPIFATYYVSSPIALKLGVTDSANGSEWVLSTNGNNETLYHNGQVVSSKVEEENKTIKRNGEREETLIYNSDGNIERKIIKEGGNTKEYNYLYSGSRLIGYNYSENGLLIEKVEYVTTSNGRLLYYTDKDGGVYLTDSYYVYDSDERESVYTGVKKEEDYITIENSDGGYTEKTDISSKRYNGLGRLVEEINDGLFTLYSYNEDGSLKEKREEKEDGIYIYRDNKTIFYTRDGVLISEREENSDGTFVEIRYIDNVPRYKFIYDLDGKRIKEAYSL